MQARKRMLTVKKGRAIIARERLLKTKLPRVRVSYAKMEAKIKLELAVVKKKYKSAGGEYLMYHLNNFRLVLPGAERFGAAKLVQEAHAIAEKRGLTKRIESLQPHVIVKKKGWDANKMTGEQVDYMDRKTVEMFQTALPIYVELRRRGYSHKALCA